MANVIKKSQLGVPIANKTVLGELTTFDDGTAKWTYRKDINPIQAGFGDRSTFTLSQQSNGNWSWSPTTDTSVQNLASREGFTTTQVTDSLYKTTTTQSVLNAGNVTNLGGISEAQKLGVPGTKGTATVTGPLPSQVSGGFSNEAGATTTTPPGATPEEKAVDLAQAEKDVKNLAISDSDTTRTVSEYPNSENLRYPIDMNPAQQDCIKFTMLEYAPSTLNLQGISKGDPLSKREITDKRRGSTVTLPIQPNISDTNTVNWGSDEMNAAELIAASAALGTITGSAEGAEEAAQATSSLLRGASEDIKKVFAAGIAQRAAGTKGLLTRVTGGIVNPNMELLFNGPQLRSFTFTFTMSAREPKESLVIRNIIRFFKQGMSVKRAKTGLFLKSPHTFEIKYMYKNEEHGWINKIKECALTSCSVNYTSAGNYATYYDGSMTSYELTLGFSELEPIYDDDYGKGSTSFDNSIGY